MDEIEALRGFRAGEIARDQAGTAALGDSLEEAITNEVAGLSTADRRQRLHPSWAVAVIGATGIAIAAVIAILVVGSRSPTSPEPIYTENALLAVPQARATEVLRHSDQIAIVTAVSVPSIEEAAPKSPPEAAGGLVTRRVTFEVERDIGPDGGGPEAGTTFAGERGGWIFRSFDDGPKEPTEFVIDGGARMQQGSRYIMPLIQGKDGWQPIMPQAEFPIIDGRVRPGATQDSPLAKELSGMTAEEASEAFAAAAR